MKIISWNINGLRAAIGKGFDVFLSEEKPDIICLQEIKISAEALAKIKLDFPGYQAFWNSAERPGYSGTAILYNSSLSPLSLKNGIALEEFDKEGRVQSAEFKEFFLLNVYFPNSNQELSRLPYKIAFNQALLAYAKNLEKKKPVVITGDFNVAYQPIDLARPKENEGSAGYTPEERESFASFLAAGLVDSFREFNPDKAQYSWWSFRTAARSRNIGWRIDYFCVSAKIKKNIIKAYILDQVLGSDHAPIGLDISLQ